MKNKNILIDYLGTDGSGPVFSLEMAKGLASNGYSVYAVISENVDNLNDWESAAFLKKVVLMPTHSSKKELLLKWYKFGLYVGFIAKKELGNITFDCVVRTFPHPMLNAVERFLHIGKNVTICHDPIPHSGEALLAKIRNYLVMKKADSVIVLTRKFISPVVRLYNKSESNVFYMPHGKMSQYKEKQQQRDVIHFEENKVYFLFFGRIEDYKGIKILGEAFLKLEKEFDNVELVVAGNGSFEAYENIYSKINHLHLINRYILDEEVGTFFNHKNVVTVVPYLDATQSGVIPIALEYGNPIIASNTGGLVEQLDDGKIGVFVEAGSVESLYSGMKELLIDAQLYKEQAVKSKMFSEKLEWENVTKVFSKII